MYTDRTGRACRTGRVSGAAACVRRSSRDWGTLRRRVSCTPRVVALRALDPAGTLVMNVALGGTAAADPIAADLDNDGADEFVVPLTSPDAIAVVDSAGAPLAGWPVPLTAPAQGAAVARPPRSTRRPRSCS
jgi:hypothetical protein